MAFEEFLSRYHQLPHLIERKELFTTSITASYSNEPKSFGCFVFSSTVEKEVIHREEIAVLQKELRWYELFRLDCTTDELTLWDEKYRRPGTKATLVIDRLGWGKARYYKVLKELEMRWKYESGQISRDGNVS